MTFLWVTVCVHMHFCASGRNMYSLSIRVIAGCMFSFWRYDKFPKWLHYLRFLQAVRGNSGALQPRPVSCFSWIRVNLSVDKDVMEHSTLICLWMSYSSARNESSNYTEYLAFQTKGPLSPDLHSSKLVYWNLCMWPHGHRFSNSTVWAWGSFNLCIRQLCDFFCEVIIGIFLLLFSSRLFDPAAIKS